MLPDGKDRSVLWRRVRLYLWGFIIGLISVYFIYGNKHVKMLTPGMLKLDQLAGQTITYTDTALCQMKCQNVSKDEVMQAMTDGKVDTKKSISFHVPHPLFNFTGNTPGGKKLNIICIQLDTITQVTQVYDMAQPNACKCP
jgi:hypothetical protein